MFCMLCEGCLGIHPIYLSPGRELGPTASLGYMYVSPSIAVIINFAMLGGWYGVHRELPQYLQETPEKPIVWRERESVARMYIYCTP